MCQVRQLTFERGALHYREFELDSYTRDYGCEGYEEFHSGMRSLGQGQYDHVGDCSSLESVLQAVDDYYNALESQ